MIKKCLNTGPGITIQNKCAINQAFQMIQLFCRAFLYSVKQLGNSIWGMSNFQL
jgi:hypothetical protein